MYIKRDMGAGRIRLSNGRYINQREFRRAMKERFPDDEYHGKDLYWQSHDDLVYRRQALEDELTKQKARNGFPSALDRAKYDREANRLPARPEAPLTQHGAEDDLWK